MRLSLFLTISIISMIDRLYEDSLGLTDDSPHVRMYWVNSKYSSCLEVNLPCECIGDNEWLLADFDPRHPYTSTFLHKTTDFMSVESEPSRGSRGMRYIAKNNPTKWIFSFEVKDDDLLVTDGPNRYLFHRVGHGNTSQSIIEVLSQLNIASLKKKCNSKSFDLNSKLSIDDHAIFYCHLDKDGRNIIHPVVGKCANKWIVKKNGESIRFLKYRNSCANDAAKIVEEFAFDAPIVK